MGLEAGESKLVPPALIKLIAELLLVVQGYTGYVLPAEQPAVAFLAPEVLQAKVCQRPCGVYGWFPPGRTIYLDDRLDPLGNPTARGILLHELVHYVQQENDAFRDESDCRRWRDREAQAFDVQFHWLAEIRAPLGALLRDRRLPLAVACGPNKAEPLG